MSDAHRRWIERWESHLVNLGGADHVWAVTPGTKGRAPGMVFLAVKQAAKDYRIIEFDEATGIAGSTLETANSPSAIMATFKSYRAIAKKERTT